jgi:signal transduction histidine kinase
LASITEKRLSLHRNIAIKKQENENLKSQLSQIQHFANIGTVTHMIAHEINNLLTPLRSYATFALQNQDDRALSEKALQKAAKSCEHASKIMESMLAMADGQQQEKKIVTLFSLVDDIFMCLCRDFSKDNINVEINIPHDLKIRVIAIQFQQVLMNLILNARQAMLARGGTLTIKSIQTNNDVEIEISDTGDGIKPEDLENVFNSFFTTKKNGESSIEHSGTGLGLAFCKKIIEDHKGRISVESKLGLGTKFKIILPKTKSNDS